MNFEKVSLLAAVLLTLGVILISSCAPAQELLDCQQENAELEKILEAQREQAMRMEAFTKLTLDMHTEKSGELSKCQEQLAKLKRENQLLSKQVGLGQRAALKEGVAELKALREKAAEEFRRRTGADAGGNEPSTIDEK